MSNIIINSILGGQGGATHFQGKGQFRASLGIDPSQPIDDLDSAQTSAASGLLRPVAAQNFTSSTITAAPMWITTNPKDSNTYVYDYQGSAYTLSSTFTGATALNDGGSLSNARGNGQAYYDNYIYQAKNTTIARYGPLDGSPAFNGDYWVTTLGKAALSDTLYPTDFNLGLRYPNHLLLRHSDGKLYITDVQGNIGVLHYIATTKTSVEGDTDNSSTASKISFGYGFYPTAIESYNSYVAVGIYEGSAANLRQTKAKFMLWDTTSTNFNQITTIEFPDSFISAIKNKNGSLYIFSGNIHSAGFRVTQYLGGYSFKEIYYSEVGEPPFGGAVDAVLNHVIMGGYTTIPEAAGCVTSFGLEKAVLGGGVFNTMRSTAPAIGSVTAVAIPSDVELGFYAPIIGWAGDGQYGIDKQGTQYNNAPSVFWSGMFRIGNPFLINAIHIPFTGAMSANQTVTASIYLDDGSTKVPLQVINSTTFASGERTTKTFRNVGINGVNNFYLELRWTGSAVCTLGLPIIIEYEVVPD